MDASILFFIPKVPLSRESNPGPLSGHPCRGSRTLLPSSWVGKRRTAPPQPYFLLPILRLVLLLSLIHFLGLDSCGPNLQSIFPHIEELCLLSCEISSSRGTHLPPWLHIPFGRCKPHTQLLLALRTCQK